MEAKEKENFLNKPLESSSSHMYEFTEATLKYFHQLIKNARRSLPLRLKVPKLLKGYSVRLHDINFQL